MTTTPDLYDVNLPSDVLTVDTPAGPVDMVAVLRHVAGETSIQLTAAERSLAKRLDPHYARHGLSAGAAARTEAYRRMARTLTSAA